MHKPLTLCLLAAPTGLWAQDDGNAAEVYLHEQLMPVIAAQDGPNAFTTDGCSGGMSEVWGLVAKLSPLFVEAHGTTPPWEICCVAHDRIYHAAGAAQTAQQSWTARLEADRALQSCVSDAAPDQMTRLSETYGMRPAQVTFLYELLGDAMFHAVRLGGMPCSGLSWRWGYGYPDCQLIAE